MYKILSKGIRPSYYSYFHKGFCVGFNSSNLLKVIEQKANEAFDKFFTKVEYKRAYPIIKPTITYFDPEYILKTLDEISTKAHPWQYEQEYRYSLISSSDIKDEDRKIIIGNDCISEITIGLAADAITKNRIINICKKRHIPVYLAKKISRKFSITRERVN